MEPKLSITPLELRLFFLVFKTVVIIPLSIPISIAGQGLGNTFELDP
jgi:hypothetical protein